MAPLIRAEQLREALYGVTLTSPAQVVPTGSTNLWVVSGGPIRITSVVLVVTTVFTGTVTTLNVGPVIAPTGLFNGVALTSLAVGAVLVGTPTPTAPLVAASGGIAWIASAGNTGQAQVYLTYIPVIPAAIAQ